MPLVVGFLLGSTISFLYGACDNDKCKYFSCCVYIRLFFNVSINIPYKLHLCTKKKFKLHVLY